MANKRDVSLVIRAKNEATKAIDSVSEALKVLSGAQDAAGKSSDKAGGLLSKLGDEARNLAAEVQGLSALQKVSSSIDKAALSVGRLQQSVEASKGSVAGFSKSYAEATANVEKLEAATRKAKAAADAQKGSTMADARRALDIQLGEQKAAIKAKLEAQRAAIATTNELVKANGGPTVDTSKTLVEQKSALAALVVEQRKVNAEYKAGLDAAKASIASQTGLKESAKSLAAQLKLARKEQGDFAVDLSKAEQSLQRQVVDLKQAETGLDGMKTAAAAAGQSLKQTAIGEKELGDAARKAAEDLKKVNEALARQPKTTQPASSAGTPTGPAASAAADYRAQTQAVKDAQVAYAAARAEATRLGAELAKTATPSRELQTSFLLAKSASAQAKTEYLAQGQALSSLQASLRATNAAAAAQASTQAQAVVTSRQKAQADRESASAAEVAAGAQKRQQAAMNASNEDTRKSLGLMQRLRGQVLSLAAAYVGLYQVVNQIGQVLTAFQALEASTSRINVATGGDMAQTAQELDFIRRNADRLGITYAVLSGEYSKFIIATKGTNLEGEKSRKIFIAIAEAGRVNKLTTEQMTGAFLAFSQMVSKGKVNAEELRGQLAERLPGAVKLFADALGVSTAKLDEMLQKGQVSSDILDKVADQLIKTYGPALAGSLNTTTTAMGQFENALFQARIAFAEGGFIEGFNAALKSLTEYLKSPEAKQGMITLGKAAGTLVQILAEIPQHINFIIIALSAFIGLRAGTAILALATNMTLARTAATAAGASLATVAVAANGSKVAVVAATASLGNLRLALGALGGPIGVALSVVAGLVAYWVTRTEDATVAMTEHQRIVDAVKNAYDKAGGKADDWAKKINGVTMLQAQTNLEALRKTVDEQFDSMSKSATRFTRVLDMPNSQANPVAATQIRTIVKALDDLKTRTIDIENFKRQVDAVGQATDVKAIKEWALKLLDAADNAKEGASAQASMEKVIRVLSGTADTAQGAMDDLNGKVEDSKRVFDDAGKGAKEFKDALDGIKGKIPELKAELDKLKGLGEIDAFEATLMQQGPMTRENMDLVARARKAEEMRSVGLAPGSSQEKSFNLLTQKEGFQATAKYDVNAYRAGFGSDTVTLADGSIQKITQGMTVSRDDASRDLVRRIGEFQDVIKGQIGSERFSAFSGDQQAALTSIAYNYGSLPKRIIEAVKTGSAKEIADSVRSLKGDNNGINRGRREAEAKLIENSTSTGLTKFAYAEQQKASDKADKEREKFREDFNTKKELWKAEEEAGNRKTLEAVVLFEIEKERIAARNAGATFDAADEAAIRRRVELTQAQKFEQEAINAKKKEEQALEQKVNDLVAYRASIVQLLENAQTSGDTQAAERLQTQLTAVNAQIGIATEAARKYWLALGGPEADAAIAKLALVDSSLVQTTNKFILSGAAIDDNFISSVSGAFSTLAESLANGENALQSFGNFFRKVASDFLMQIAQMILKQALFNALQGAFGGTGGSTGFGGVISSAIGSLFHTGGVVGEAGGASRAVSPAWFMNAQRYHSGGLPGLSSSEVPAILQKGEEVLTGDDPRNVLNGGMGGGAPANVKIVNTIDAGSFISEGLNSNVGEQSFLNYVRANSSTVKSALGL